MTGLLREHTHKLFERSTRFTHFKLHFHSIRIHKITSERRIMVRIIPIPTDTSFVVITENPLQTLNVRSFDIGSEFVIVLLSIYQKLLAVISHFPTFNSKLHIINILCNFSLVFSITKLLRLFNHKFLSQFILLSI